MNPLSEFGIDFDLECDDAPLSPCLFGDEFEELEEFFGVAMSEAPVVVEEKPAVLGKRARQVVDLVDSDSEEDVCHKAQQEAPKRIKMEPKTEPKTSDTDFTALLQTIDAENQQLSDFSQNLDFEDFEDFADFDEMPLPSAAPQTSSKSEKMPKFQENASGAFRVISKEPFPKTRLQPKEEEINPPTDTTAFWKNAAIGILADQIIKNSEMRYRNKICDKCFEIGVSHTRECHLFELVRHAAATDSANAHRCATDFLHRQMRNWSICAINQRTHKIIVDVANEIAGKIAKGNKSVHAQLLADKVLLKHAANVAMHFRGKLTTAAPKANRFLANMILQQQAKP